MTDPHAHLRIFVPEVVGITFNPKDNTWLVMPSAGFNFAKADSKCKKCLGQGRSGYADVTWNNGPGKIMVVCPKCYGRMKLPEAPEQKRPGWIMRLIAFIVPLRCIRWCAAMLDAIAWRRRGGRAE